MAEEMAKEGGNISACNRWRGGDKQMKIGPAMLAQWNCWEIEGNRMTEWGWRDGEEEKGKGKGKKIVKGVGVGGQRIKQWLKNRNS